MEVVCEQCSSKFNIPEEKIPEDKAFSITCPRCKNKISVKPGTDNDSSDNEDENTLLKEISSESYDAGDKPFDFLEEGMKTALICEQDPELRAKISAAVKKMGYHTTEPDAVKDALKQMRFHVFDLIVLNELFGTSNPNENHIHRYIEQLGMVTRRHIYVSLLTKKFRTMDNMAAFNKSVNQIINLKNIDEFEKILTHGISDNERFYKPLMEALAATGHI
ncbi:MAG: zinc-ribbon domain-containing protein [Desulfobacterales bacterium]|nr:zinc-ribbon domain-containing protein [Desulfobacterales bacterium]